MKKKKKSAQPRAKTHSTKISRKGVGQMRKTPPRSSATTAHPTRPDWTELTCLPIEQKVSPVGVRLHEAPVEELVDRAAQHQPRHVISDLLRFVFHQGCLSASGTHVPYGADNDEMNCAPAIVIPAREAVR